MKHGLHTYPAFIPPLDVRVIFCCKGHFGYVKFRHSLFWGTESLALERLAGRQSQGTVWGWIHQKGVEGAETLESGREVGKEGKDEV